MTVEGIREWVHLFKGLAVGRSKTYALSVYSMPGKPVTLGQSGELQT